MFFPFDRLDEKLPFLQTSHLGKHEKTLNCSFLLLLLAASAGAQGLLDLETGAVVGGAYNRIRVPGNAGTEFDLTGGDFRTQPVWLCRVRAGYTFADRHTVSLLYAPFSLRAGAGRLSEPIRFNGATFAAGRPLYLRYTFNSYRLTYRFDFVRKERLRFGAGLTAKIRDAAIRLDNGEVQSTKTNVGYVPLINLLLDWGFSQKVGLLLEGEALATPQGRAENVFAGIRYRPAEAFGFRVGYRLLEGGADNKEVYNFTLIHYLSAGVTWRF
jgi:hypothetical protein